MLTTGMSASHHRRAVAMRMLRRGEITIAEAAMIALVSRQRVRKWCETTGIDMKKARENWLSPILTRLNKTDR